MRFQAILLASLIASVASAKESWIEAHSEHFTLVTDAGKGTAENILEDLEQLRRLLALTLPSHPLSSGVPTGMFAFRSEKSMRDFQPLREGKPEDWAAMFRPTSFKNFILFRADGPRERVREVAFQQYLYLLMSYGKSSYPLWLRNGLSLFYANASIGKGQAEVGKMHSGHRRELGEYRAMPIPQLFAVTYASPTYREETRRPLFDAQSWALVHYVVIGRNPEGVQMLDQYLRLLGDGQDRLLAFQQSMKMPVDEIEAAVATYIRKSISQYFKVELPAIDAARDFQVTPLPEAVAEARLGELLVSVGRLEDARRRLTAVVESAPDVPDGYEGLGFLSAVEQDSKSALAFLEKAVAKGATNPQVHYRYARILLDQYGDSDIPEPARASATASLEKALAADPTHADAARLFGYLRLFDGSAQQGVDVVKKALETNDGNPWLLFILGQLYARQENFSAARAVYEHLLSRKLDSDLNAGVRRQYDWVVAKMSNP